MAPYSQSHENKRALHCRLFLWRGILFQHYLQLGGEVFYIFIKEQMKINGENVSLDSLCVPSANNYEEAQLWSHISR